MTDNCERTILVVDDDLHILEVLEARLSSVGCQVLKAPGPREALKILKMQPVDLMISDMKMPDMGGMELLREARSFLPSLPVVFLTAYGTIPDAVTAVKEGAVDYLTKPFDGRELLKKVNEVFETASALRTKESSPPSGLSYEGNSPAMKELHELIERVSTSDVNVLILGESGVGKERVARLIHALGSRRDQPFVVVDCGSTPTSLLETELFGHVRGAFTNAIRNKKGLIEAANGGTLLLDEVGNVSPEMQIRLLRFLEERKIRKIGDLREIPVDCRVIAATNADLAEDTREGRFREDLYYRLRVVTLKIPPLRDRKEDIGPLAQYFVDTFSHNDGMKKVELPPETVKWLCNYPWPGNVRELKNAIEAGVVLCKDGFLHPSDFNLTAFSDIPRKKPNESDSLSLEETERNAILRALQQAGGVQKNAAKLLGISRRAIHYKIKKFGINPKA
jgi:DNA-binding NtrC family response regulator